MRPGSDKPARDGVRRVVTGVGWLYAALGLLVWWGEPLIPGNLPVLRILHSLVCDLAWLPLGIIAWSYLSFIPCRLAGWGKQHPQAFIAVAGAVMVLLHLLFFETAFRLLFIPLIVLSLGRLFLPWMRGASTGWLPWAVSALLLTFQYGGQLVPSLSFSPAGPGIAVLTYNLRGDAGEGDRRAVLEQVARSGADIACCIEYFPRRDLQLTRDILGDTYPHMATSVDTLRWRAGEALFSRHPIIDSTVHIYPDSLGKPHAVLTALIDTPEGPVSVTTLHLRSSGHRLTALVDSTLGPLEVVRRANEEEYLPDRRKFLQARYVAERIVRPEVPSIVCGDFNDTPNSRVYRQFSALLQDSYRSVGWGTGATFGEVWMRHHVPVIPSVNMVRIDYIFVSGHWETRGAAVLRDAKHSDHKPVIARLVRRSGVGRRP